MKFFSAFILMASFAMPVHAESVGMASYYKMGGVTASGEAFRPMGLTAAHRKLSFGTKLKVTNLRNGRTVIVRVNDRGPFIGSRILDLSLGAANVIGLTQSGIAKISFVIVQ